MSEPGHFHEPVKKAAAVLGRGGVVAFPTESFYGLGVDASNEAALSRLFTVKGRDRGRPLLVLVPHGEMVDRYAQEVPGVARVLMETFWPGGLTLVFRAGPHVSPLLTAQTGRIGIRYSSHPLAAALTKTLGKALTGTSANLSGQPACSSAEAVVEAFGGAIDLVLDGGHTAGEIGSTVLDVTGDPPRILRQGMVTRRQLEAVIAVR